MKRLIIRGGLFIVLCGILLSILSLPFRVEDYRIRETLEELYTTEPDSCDAILLGGSNVYTYWVTPRAWEDHGISVLNMGIPSMPSAVMRYYIEEVRKTQPNALFVITTNSFKWALESKDIHFSTDYLRPSLTKFAAINRLCDVKGYGLERFKFYFPIFEFHGNWSTLSSKAYVAEYEHVKAGSSYSSYLFGQEDLTDRYVETEERVELSEGFSSCLNDLFDYIEDNDVRVLFVRLPQAMGNEDSVARLNSVCDLIQERNFDYLDLHDNEDVGIDHSTDFYSIFHTNIHGAVKFTDYLSDYLIETYGFTDKRGQEGYEDWDDAGYRYKEYMLLSVLDFELDHSARDWSLKIGPLSAALTEANTVRLDWDPVEDADALYVYRQVKLSGSVGNPLLLDNMHDALSIYRWQRVATLPATANTYEDTSTEDSTTYRYVVVPVTGEGSSVAYGSFSYHGAKIKTAGDAS